jgi:protein associated with RNAse G/E
MMHNHLVTVNSRKYDLKIRKSWQCHLIERDDSLLTLVGEFDSDISHAGLGSIARGTMSKEYYWLDRWYNVFHFCEPDGSFRNFYCNITMPPKFEDLVIDYVDLDLDVIVWPDGASTRWMRTTSPQTRSDSDIRLRFSKERSIPSRASTCDRRPRIPFRK